MSELPVTYDPETLHERYADPSAASVRIDELRAEVRTAPDVIAELAARADLVTLLRGVDQLDEALTEARRAVDRAEIDGNAAQQHTARLRLAAVQQRRGDFADANLIHTELLAVADQFGPVIEAFTYQYAGENDFDQGHWADAREHFARAWELREQLELPEREISQLALAAADRKLAAG